MHRRRRLLLPPARLVPCFVAALLVCATGCASRSLRDVSTTVVPARAATTGTLARDVQLLRSEDFVVRARASERLALAGEPALGALGAAGEGTVRVLGGQEVGTTGPVLRTILHDLPPERLYVHLDGPWPVVRRETADELGRRGRWGAVPRLIPRMEDEDASVRAAAASSLRRLTNRFFGFDANAQLHARRRAAERWREWWAIEGRVRTGRDDGNGAG